MNDPYQILGIARDASDEEIKKAYRVSSRKYHPDANVNNPNKEEAEANFKEVQRAYQDIMKMRSGEYEGSEYYRQQGGFGYGGFGGFWGDTGQGGRSGSQTDYMRSAVSYIRAGYYKEALNVLNQVTDRTGEWYYYSAVANLAMGNNVIAKEHASTAVRMQPDNWEYQNLLNRIESGAAWYQERSAPFGGIGSGSGGMCMKLCIANLLCNMCCGGSGMCCGGYGPRGIY